MHFTSSPLEYPPTSSPSHDSPRKKRRVHEDRQPLRNVPTNEIIGRGRGFLDEDSDEDSSDVATWKHQKASAQYESLQESAIQLTSSTGDEAEQTIDLLRQSPTDIHRSTLSSSLAYVTSSDILHQPQEAVPARGMQHSVRTCSGRNFNVRRRADGASISYQKIVSARSTEVAGRAQKSYYGVDIHHLIDEGTKENQKIATSRNESEVEKQNRTTTALDREPRPSRTLLWTEKYRARKFTDLVGDERTHRSVLRWLKAWDPIVFSGAIRPKSSKKKNLEEQEPEKIHRKVLLITGPPGLGKTTLAHVCARQAGYEVLEINASDERSKDTVKGRIRDMVCTENVRPVEIAAAGRTKCSARPVCVVVDEVDGVVSGSGAGGDGGFMKALADLLSLDQKNSVAAQRRNTSTEAMRKKKKGDNFRLLRPLILICNDLYHPSLRILRQGTLAEVVYVRKPPLSMIIPRLQCIFIEEGIPCDSDGVRQLCEAAWGVSTRKENKSANGTAEGDMRGILVIGEWVASKLRAEQSQSTECLRLTKNWIQQSVLSDLAHGGGAARSLGRGGSKEAVDRVFAHNAGFPIAIPSSHVVGSRVATSNVADAAKERIMHRLAEIIESSGEGDRILTDCFASYPTRPFQDDTYLTKPMIAYDWLHFHDVLTTSVHSAQEWELAAYLTSPVLAFHHLFASTSAYSHNAHGTTAMHNDDATENSHSSSESSQFSGLRASYAAHEALKAAQAQLTHLQSSLSLPLLRSFRSIAELATDLLPYVLRILNPDVKPVVVGGSGEKGIASVRRGAEKEMVLRGVEAMIACGLKYERNKVEWESSTSAGVGGVETGATTSGGWVFRMEPAVDSLSVFETMSADPGSGATATQKVRYAVRQVLDQEWRRETARREQEARVRRGTELVHQLETNATGAHAGSSRITAKGGHLPAGPSTGSTHIRNGAAKVPITKRDFFGRPIVIAPPVKANNDDEVGVNTKSNTQDGQAPAERVWVTYHEGFSNAVRKPITMKELMEGL